MAVAPQRLHCNDGPSPGLFRPGCPHYHSATPSLQIHVINPYIKSCDRRSGPGDRLAHVRDTVLAVVLGLGINGLGVVRALGRAGVRSCADLLPNMVFQEVVPSGDGHIHVCTLLLDKRGELVLSYTGRKIRQYPPDFGNTCFGVSEQNEDLLRLASRFLRAVGYHGLCTLEFARHRQTGRFVLLETNLRSYLHNQLFYDCGLNFPLAEYRLLTGGPLPQHRTQRNGIHWLYFTRDAGCFYRKFGAKEIDGFAWIRSLPRARSFAAFAMDDLVTWIYETARLLRRIWSVAARTVRYYARTSR